MAKAAKKKKRVERKPETIVEIQKKIEKSLIGTVRRTLIIDPEDESATFRRLRVHQSALLHVFLYSVLGEFQIKGKYKDVKDIQLLPKHIEAMKESCEEAIRRIVAYMALSDPENDYSLSIGRTPKKKDPPPVSPPQ